MMAVGGPQESRPARRPPGEERTTRGNADGDESIRAGAAATLIAQIVSGAFTAGVTVFLVRALGPVDYGLLALSLGVALLLLVAADLGVGPAVERFVAARRYDRVSTERVVAGGFALRLPIALGVSGGLFACAPLIAQAYSSPGLTGPLRGLALALTGQSLFLYFRGVFIALRRTRLNLVLYLSEGAFEASATVALVLAGMGATGAALGRSVGYAFGAVLALLLYVRLVGRATTRMRGRGGESRRELLAYGRSIWLTTATFVLFEQIGLLIVGAFLGSLAVGMYAAPLRFLPFCEYAGIAAAAGVAPVLGHHAERVAGTPAYKSATRSLIMLHGLALAPVIVWAGPITHLVFGGEYDSSAQVLRALAPTIFLAGLAPFFAGVTNYLGEARRRFPVALATVGTSLALATILVPAIGVVGAAFATDAGFALYVLGHERICLRTLGIGMGADLRTFARTLLAAAAMSGVLLCFGHESLSAADALGGMFAGVAVYIVVLIVLREIAPSDLRAVSFLPRMALSGKRANGKAETVNSREMALTTNL